VRWSGGRRRRELTAAHAAAQPVIVEIDPVAQRPPDTGQKPGDLGFADAKNSADLGALQVVDVQQHQDLLLALGERGDRRLEHRRPLAGQRSQLGVELTRRGLQGVADLDRHGLLVAPGRGVEGQHVGA
jgi:hypothetical protein